MKAYQKDNGLTETGVADQALLTALEAIVESVVITLPRAVADALRDALAEA